jgi:serine/threonine protein kinase
MMLCLTTGPETTEPVDHELKPMNPQANTDIFPPFKLFLSSICHSDIKLSNIMVFAEKSILKMTDSSPVLKEECSEWMEGALEERHQG